MSLQDSFEVLSYDDPQQRQKWRSVLRHFKDIDIFFYPEYVYLFELKGDGKAYCFVYYDGDKGLVIYPFLKRTIKDLAIFADLPDSLIDITSPYGYGGYLRSSEKVDMDNFFTIFHNYCSENNIVSEFIRFNPILQNFSYCSPKVDIQEWNETVCMDLSLTENQLWQNMKPSCRNKIKKAQKSGITILQDQNFAHLDKFYELYIETMHRLEADEFYFFPRKWLDDLVQLLSNNIALFHARYQDEIIMSGILLFTNNVIHYFLSGSIHNLRDIGSNNLLLYKVALWAKNQGVKLFHLGGGYQPNDTLFEFKSSFSPILMNYSIGRVIHNKELYRDLSEKRQIFFGKHQISTTYFPAYRSEIKDSIIIVGASEHARVCLDIILAQGQNIIGFCDDDPRLENLLIHGYRVLGKIDSIFWVLQEDKIDYIIGIGENEARKEIANLLSEKFTHRAVNVIHPSAIISPRVTMGYGNFIAPGVIINTDTQIGNYTIINTGATLDHDNVIHDFAQISPGCNLAGNVTIKEGAFLGTGAVVIPRKTIGAYAVVGAGAVVIQDIPPFCTAVGVPARVIKQGFALAIEAEQ